MNADMNADMAADVADVALSAGLLDLRGERDATLSEAAPGV